MFDEVFENIENEEYKELAAELMKTIPEYFYKVGASSTGKYHPDYAVGEGGLYRHTIALCRFLEHIFETGMFNLASEDRDMLRIAGIMHDSRKSGDQADYEANKYTKYDHPLLAAEVVRAFSDKYPGAERIASIMESHMGQWNKDKEGNEILPLPKDKLQCFLHLADYLASRKDLDVQFEGYTPRKREEPKGLPDDYVLKSGKNAGMRLCDLDDGFLEWVVNKEDFGNIPMKITCKRILEKRRGK